MKKTVIVSAHFDDLRSRQVRFLEEAARQGPLHVLLWSDGLAQALTGQAPRFPQAERQYFVEAMRYVEQVSLIDALHSPNHLPPGLLPGAAAWAVPPEEDSQARAAFCREAGLDYRVIREEQLQGFPLPPPPADFSSDRKKVIVTGCYDWLHTGHVRFFEEVSQLGDLYVVVGSDANVRLLKGEGHPLFRQEQRMYMVQAVRYVKAALVSTGSGWMDAAPEIERIRPDIYAVNEDGDKPDKREFCQQHGLEYVVLKRAPKAGLPRRESTHLRGF